MSSKPTRSEILYNKRLSEEDRQRERRRQQAYRDVKATASLYRKLPVDPKHSYQNAEGYSVTCDSLPLSLL
ncbi:hypothetical protein MHZ90_14345 [Pantoea sp. ACRSH]|uniref:hypothetical protein n=1 Tax=unclassified Pantoea TaxID=2630326 RepID=UPI001EF70BAB|nr:MULTISPECIES: hypothetical protein [unclassified Pantoea]MCG7367301.1 hypothetical protein [Pantoea sp. ACRSH]MCG7397594.1 hypothetical protein [Pantoea sp. ACRSC]